MQFLRKKVIGTLRIVGVVVFCVWLVGCAQKERNARDPEEKIKIVKTTFII